MSKFTPLDLEPYFNANRKNEPTGLEGTPPWHKYIQEKIRALPGGPQVFWGVPFALVPAEAMRSWIRLRGGEKPMEVDIASSRPITFVLFAHFCNASFDPKEEQLSDLNLIPVLRPGEHLADYDLVFGDSVVHRQPIRRRFEINEPTIAWGQLAFAAKPHVEDRPLNPLGSHDRGAWGINQMGSRAGAWISEQRYWIYALPNPYPERPLKSIRIEASGADTLAIAGITLYHGDEHPLRLRRLETLGVEFQEGAAATESQPMGVDLGVLARVYTHPAFQPETWLASPMKGFGEPENPEAPVERVLIDLAVAPDATLRIGSYHLAMREVFAKGKVQTGDGKVRVELLTPKKTWLHVSVMDDETGALTPVRVHFRAPDGRYLPPYGHRHQVNDNWFEDYGGDLKLGSTQYAYVDGRFQIEMPVGECYVELSKGFEYEPIRAKLHVEAGQRELTLRLERPFNLRRKGWITADTHVHFLSPQTAWLEAQAEGINLVNLLASQWGDLFTNITDITGDLSGVSGGDTLVWVGTENRQHMLGHISLLGVKKEPVFPLCASGPDESYLGDPTWTSLTEWADQCRARDGVVVLPHFPNPYAEAVADVLLGKVDGVEIREFYTPRMNTYGINEWYRFLNLGCRVAAVGGTDKMSAGMPVGGVRTYTYLGDKEFTFANWGAAVRAGRTFTTSGPILQLEVEGKGLGEEIRLPVGGGTLEVRAWASSLFPLDALQLVMNGQVTDEVQTDDGRYVELRSKVWVDQTSWIAARCIGAQKAWHVWPVHVAAHTSPVYVKVGDQEQFSSNDASYMLTLLEGGMTWIDTLSIRADADREARIRGVFEKAYGQLSARLERHKPDANHTYHWSKVM